jgi:hypothetical protein
MALTIDGSDPSGDLGDLLDDKLDVATAVSDYLPIAGGKILQTVSVTKTDTFSASVGAGANTAITGLTLTITPGAVGNKLLIIPSVVMSFSNFATRSGGILLTQGGTAIAGALGNTAGSRIPATFTASSFPDGQTAQTVSGTYLHSPASTSALTIAVNVINFDSVNNATIVVNRSSVDGDNANSPRAISTLTIMEISA